MSVTKSIRRQFARSGGWFWLPCPLCGEEFGGYEWHDYDGKPSSVPCHARTTTAHGICPTCTRAGRGERPPWPREQTSEPCPYC